MVSRRDSRSNVRAIELYAEPPASIWAGVVQTPMARRFSTSLRRFASSEQLPPLQLYGVRV